MGIRCGIVGLPNVGKSTLFTALSRTEVEAANYPFCTIEPNVGIVPVPDPRLDNIAKIASSAKVIPAAMEFVDIAGLVAGAATGEGLGNKFLANIRETQAILHVVRCFADENVTHVSGKVDPLADISVIDTELQLADLEALDKAHKRLQKELKAGGKDIKSKLEIVAKMQELLDDGQSLHPFVAELDEEMQKFVRSLQLLMTKPVLFIANVDESGGGAHLQALEDYADSIGAGVVPICAAIEAEIAQLDAEDQQEFLSSLGQSEPGLNRVIRSGFALLGLQTYFTAGPKEARAWTIKIGATAPNAAGVIHTDFERGFIKAEVIAYADYVECNGESGAKEAGKWRQEGKDYIVQDGDVILFRFNV